MPSSMTYQQFGDNFIRMILHEQRVLSSIDRVLGAGIELGPMGAGPGRFLATVKAAGAFRPTYGEQVDDVDGHLAYRVQLPVDVDFELNLPIDAAHRFRAEVLIPLLLTVRVEDPLVIVWDIETPEPDDVTIKVVTDKRRSALLQRMSGLDEELRRFLVRVVAKELEKPHVRKARRIEMLSVIDAAWPVIADQFLPLLEPAEPQGEPGQAIEAG